MMSLALSSTGRISLCHLYQNLRQDKGIFLSFCPFKLEDLVVILKIIRWVQPGSMPLHMVLQFSPVAFNPWGQEQYSLIHKSPFFSALFYKSKSHSYLFMPCIWNYVLILFILKAWNTLFFLKYHEIVSEWRNNLWHFAIMATALSSNSNK